MVAVDAVVEVAKPKHQKMVYSGLRTVYQSDISTVEQKLVHSAAADRMHSSLVAVFEVAAVVAQFAMDLLMVLMVLNETLQFEVTKNSEPVPGNMITRF